MDLVVRMESVPTWSRGGNVDIQSNQLTNLKKEGLSFVVSTPDHLKEQNEANLLLSKAANQREDEVSSLGYRPTTLNIG